MAEINFDLLKYLSSGIIFIDENKKIRYINEIGKKVFKRNIGDSCEGLFSVCKNCPLDRLKENPQSIHSFDTKLLCCERNVCHSIIPIFENGKFVGLLEEFRDSTELINSMKELKKQKEFTETILNSVVDAIIVIDKEGNIIHYNVNAKNLICREIDDISGMNIKFLLGLGYSELPSPNERTDLIIETPALGKLKVSFLRSLLKEGEGEVLSFYVLPDCMINQEIKGRIITKSPKMQSILEMVKTIADTNVSVLIEGETGTGKSILAKYIHTLSSRRDKPFIKINCAAIPENLLESELFGYVKGAFTGATKDKPGKVELADGGTLFLDEIGDMSLYLQSKILHLIQEKEFERLGDIKSRKVNIRIIAATNKDLQKLIEEGKFREDLYYRLKVISIKIPPLRERKEDIPYLINYFISKYSKEYKRSIKGISPEAMKILLEYDYPGNIRELENIIERAIIICSTGYIQVSDLPEDIRIGKNTNKNILFTSNQDLKLINRETIIKALRETNGNKTLAAKLLGIHRTTLWRKIKEFNIEV